MRIPTFFLALLSLGFLAGGSAVAMGVNTTVPSSRTEGSFVTNSQVGEAPSGKADSEKESGENEKDQSGDPTDQGGDQTDSGNEN
jgi:hypothetical protein